MRTLLLALSVLAGCYRPRSGTVEQRSFTPAYSWVQLTPVRVSKYSTVMVPITHRRPDTWALLIRDDVQATWVVVDKDEHDAHPKGTHWQREKQK